MMHSVPAGHHAYLTGTSYELQRNVYGFCDVTWLDEFFYETPKAWALPLGSPFKRRFDAV